MSKARIAICIAANKWQHYKWWTSWGKRLLEIDRDPDMEISSVQVLATASPDFTKSQMSSSAALGMRRDAMTDMNRSAIVDAVLKTDATHIYWFDDDTVHPPHTCRQLLDLDEMIASGVYYTKRTPSLPIAYYRNGPEDDEWGPVGTYRHLIKWRKGEILRIDSVGMGCALVKVELYEFIRDHYDLFYRDNHTPVPVLQSKTVIASDADAELLDGLENWVVTTEDGKGYYVQSVREANERDLTRNESPYWPFYAMEYERTEDHYFCELAAGVGVRPLLDTNINCGHWGDKEWKREDYRKYEPAIDQMIAKGDVFDDQG